MSLLRHLFFILGVRPFLLFVLGLNIRGQERLPRRGPALVVANHNSHLDVFVLMCLFPQRMLGQVSAVAAADYFLRNAVLGWFALNIVGIIPLERRPRGRGDPFAAVSAALEAGGIVILFPEGTRGTPEQLATFKTGIAHLVARHPSLPVVPVFLHGLGKALPKGEALLVPFFCDVFVGEPVRWRGDRRVYMTHLADAFARLAEEAEPRPWC